MSEFSWGPGIVEDARADSGGEQAGTLALSADEFSALEERILRAVNLVKRERLARSAAEERATLAEARATEQAQSTENLQKENESLQRDTQNLHKELETLRAERDQVRQRVERLLSQLDALEA